jgi:hypothetical protein
MIDVGRWRQVERSTLVGDGQRVGLRRWLSAARHPAWPDGVIAAALLVLPWVLAWGLAPRHHLDATTVIFMVSVTIPLAGLWLTWAAFRNANRPSLADGGAAPGGITARPGSAVAGRGGIAFGPGSVMADRGGTAIGQLVQPRPGITGKPVRLAEPPPLLAGREELLADLDARLTEGDGREPRIIALCGFGGVGKTSVAVAYARRHLTEVGLAWQFAAYDPMVLEAEFGELAAQFGARDVVDTRNPVASVHGMLAAFSARWLLVFDNVRDQASVERFLPPAGSGQVLITSQNPNWPHGQVVQVPVLGTEAAADFLVTRSGDPDRQAGRDLAGEMDGLPLALEQAAAYILATGGNLAMYLGLLRQRRAEMLSRGEPTGYRETVTTTWSLAFAQLEQSAPKAVGLLRLLAFYASEAIPLPLLLQPRPGLAEKLSPQVAGLLVPLLEDELAAEDAVAALREYSLISTAGAGAVSVHRLVQAVTADHMPADMARAWRHAAAAVIEAAAPDNVERSDSWPVLAALVPHAQAALTADSNGMAQIAEYLGVSGNYVAACELYRRAVQARVQVLGPEHPDTLTVYNILAHWMGVAGDAAGARDLSAALLPVRVRVSGPEHQETLVTRGNLARWTGAAGDAAGARDQFAALLPAIERVLGPEHKDALTARANLASFMGAAGDAAGARDEYVALLPVAVRVLGPEHPDTLAVYNNLAHWRGAAGDAAGARDLYAALLPVIERAFAPEHPNTLATRNNLAHWTAQAEGGSDTSQD